VNVHTSTTNLERQNRRLDRLRERGITRTTVLVHDDARPILDSLRSTFVDPGLSASLLNAWHDLNESREPTNVATVQHISPFRYPGGKTWLVPEVRRWLQSQRSIRRFVEPFAGGASCGLMVANEHLVETVVLGELDVNVAAVWELLVDGSDQSVNWLCKRIETFDMMLRNVRVVLDAETHTLRDRAFRTLVQNRTARGGILAPGAGLSKSGEAGRGLKSRWYPETLVKRIRLIRSIRGGLSFQYGDAFDLIKTYSRASTTAWLIDPPYTVSGTKRAGARLYSEFEVDHDELFRRCAELKGPVMMTYNDSVEVRDLAKRFGFAVSDIAMKSTHHAVHRELLLTKA
jgi:DNA adenine methylase